MSFRRGVWIAPWRGKNNEFVLYAMDSRGRLVSEPVTIPVGGDHVAVADGLWDLLDAAEPEFSGIMGSRPTFTLLDRPRRFRRLRMNLPSRHDPG